MGYFPKGKNVYAFFDASWHHRTGRGFCNPKHFNKSIYYIGIKLGAGIFIYYAYSFFIRKLAAIWPVRGHGIIGVGDAKITAGRGANSAFAGITAAVSAVVVSSSTCTGEMDLFNDLAADDRML